MEELKAPFVYSREQQEELLENHGNGEESSSPRAPRNSKRSNGFEDKKNLDMYSEIERESRDVSDRIPMVDVHPSDEDDWQEKCDIINEVY